MQVFKEVSLEKIAAALPLPILFESRRKKVQRYLSLPLFNVETLWLPIIKNWLALNFAENQPLYLVIGRTSWAKINLMMMSIVYDKRAIPIYFELLPKIGSSNETEQKSLCYPVFKLLKGYKIIVLELMP